MLNVLCCYKSTIILKMLSVKLFVFAHTEGHSAMGRRCGKYTQNVRVPPQVHTPLPP